MTAYNRWVRDGRTGSLHEHELDEVRSATDLVWLHERGAHAGDMWAAHTLWGDLVAEGRARGMRVYGTRADHPSRRRGAAEARELWIEIQLRRLELEAARDAEGQ